MRTEETFDMLFGAAYPTIPEGFQPCVNNFSFPVSFDWTILKTFVFLFFRKEIEIEIVEENCYEKNVSFFVELKSPKEESNGKGKMFFCFVFLYIYHYFVLL